MASQLDTEYLFTELNAVARCNPRQVRKSHLSFDSWILRSDESLGNVLYLEDTGV